MMQRPHLGWSAKLLWRNVPNGYTFETAIAHVANNGGKNLSLFLGTGDGLSSIPHFEARPGEFYVGGRVTRDGNGDVTSQLYTVNDSIPSDCDLMQVFDLCQQYGLSVTVQLTNYSNLKNEWRLHPYNLNSQVTNGNLRQMGIPGWLPDWESYFTDQTAKSYYKNMVDAFCQWFGNHPALGAIDIGNELTLYYWTYRKRSDAIETEANLMAWLEEMALYIWNALPGVDDDKPMITLSTPIFPTSGNVGDVSVNYAYNMLANILPANKFFVTWHDYGGAHTLSRIRSAIKQFGAIAPVKIGENWPYPAGPSPVPPQYQDINLEPYVYDNGTGGSFWSYCSELTPYAHTRMEAYLLATIPNMIGYSRWWSFVDGYGKSTWHETIMRIPEIVSHIKPFYDICNGLRYDISDNVTGNLDLVSVGKKHGVVAGVLVGNGTQIVGIPVVGNWWFESYDWQSGATVEATMSVDGQLTIDFSKYSRGFVPFRLAEADIMTLLTRLLGTDPVEEKIPVHQFMAVLAEYKRGKVTGQQIVSAFGLSAQEAVALQSFLTNLDGDKINRSVLHDVLMLGEAGLYPLSKVRERLGV